MMATFKIQNEEEKIGCFGDMDFRLTLTLLGISFSYMIVTAPRGLLMLKPFEDPLTQQLFCAITKHMFHANFAFNCLFYFFLASECRKEFKNSVLKCCTCDLSK